MTFLRLYRELGTKQYTDNRESKVELTFSKEEMRRILAADPGSDMMSIPLRLVQGTSGPKRKKRPLWFEINHRMLEKENGK